MIKKEHYIISILIMVVTLVMFQSLGIATSIFQNEDVNAYANRTSLTAQSAITDFAVEEKEEVAILDSGHTWVKDWAIYKKKTYQVYPSLSSLTQSEASLMIVNPDDLDIEDYTRLYTMLSEGRVVVFTKLPDTSLLQDEMVKKVLGVKAYNGLKKIEFIKVYDGLFIGDETHYQEDVDLMIEYVNLESGYKVFMDGYLEGQIAEIKNEEMPPMMWRSYVNEGFVYVMNHDFMEDTSLGMGILTGICNDYQPYSLYPVVNAKSTVLVNFPMISNENEEALMQRYSRSSISLMRDVVYPQLISILDQIECKGTFLFSSRLDYDIQKPIDEETLTFYMQHLNREGAEFGLSGIQISSISLDEKLRQDLDVFQNLYPNYKFAVFAADKEDDDTLRQLMKSQATDSLKTFFVGENSRAQLFDYLNDEGLYIQSNWNMNEYSYMNDLKMKSLFTSLGMMNMTVDMKNLIYPQSDSDDWTVLSKDMSRYAQTYLRPYTAFQSTLLSEADARIRRFMALDFKQTRDEDVIHVAIDNFEEEAYFILNVHGEEIVSVQNGTYTKVDDGVYLLEAQATSMSITLKEAG